MSVNTGYTIENLIGLPALMGLMQETTTGLTDPVPDSFNSPKRQVLGNSARLFIGYGQRQTSKLVKYGSPSVQGGMEPLGAKDFILISTKEVQAIDPLSFQRLHQFESFEMQKMGAGEVARQVSLFKEKFENTRKVQKWSTLRNAKVWADSSGNLLPSSSGASADWTLDFGAAAGHQTQLNFDGNGDLIANLWSDATNANIPAQLENIDAAAAKESGLLPKNFFYGSAVPGFVRKNTFCQAFMVYDPGMYRTLNRSSSIPNDFLGRNWIPVQNAFFKDNAGVNQSMFGAKEVIMTPEPEKGGWWEFIEGSEIVPNSIDISNRTAKDIMANARTVYGMWATSQYQFDGSISLLNHVGDNFLFAIRNPKAWWNATVSN